MCRQWRLFQRSDLLPGIRPENAAEEPACPVWTDIADATLPSGRAAFLFLLRAIFQATVQIRLDDARRSHFVLEAKENDLPYDLRPPELVDAGRGVRHAVPPLFVAIVV